jgi:hypothetical protein
VRLPRFVAPFFLLAGLVLIPWTVWLTYSLPTRHETDDWRLVWAGFDIALVIGLLATAVAALRRSPWLAVVAAAAGTLLCTDAWFDITLEVGGPHLVSSVLEAAFVELPLATICFWVARDVERALERAFPPRPWQRAVARALAEPADSVWDVATSRDDLRARGPASPRPRTRDPRRPAGRSQAE